MRSELAMFIYAMGCICTGIVAVMIGAVKAKKVVAAIACVIVLIIAVLILNAVTTPFLV